MQESDRKQAAKAAADILIQHPLFKTSRHIACYYSAKSEFDTKPLIEAIWEAGKVCYLPILTETKALHFVRYHRNDELQLNQYSIPEPVNTQQVIQTERLDLVLTPLTAFDRNGNRVGTGGGFYDRTFAFLFSKRDKSPTILGVGYAMQECEEIQSDPWDMKLDGVLTESALIEF